MPRITRKAVDALTEREREYMVWDSDIKGFGVRVHPSGRKVYVVKYRDGGRVIKKTIGPHDAIPPAAARGRAAEIITVARTGRDLTGQVLTPRTTDAPTVHSLAERFLEEHVPGHCKPSTAHSYTLAIRQHVVPRLGSRKVAEVTRADVASLHQRMRATPFAANRTLGILSAMFSAAELWGLRPQGSNPCRYVKRFRESKRERFLSDAEYRRLGATLREAESTGVVAAPAVAAIRLLMLTGCRLSEIMNLRWDHVALEARELRLPRTKTGAYFLPVPVSSVQCHAVPN